MSRYYDYFQEQEPTTGEVAIDEFIAEAMRTDLKFKTLAEELHYQRTSRITLMNELLICYQYLKEQICCFYTRLTVMVRNCHLTEFHTINTAVN